MSSRFFWRLYASYAAVLLLTSIVIGLLVQAKSNETLREEHRTYLRQSGLLLSPFAESVFDDAAPSAFLGQVGQLATLNPDMRVTLVRPDGDVVVDTWGDAAQMDNHAQRPEVAHALASGEGWSTRRSPTVDQELVYYARLIERDGEPLGVVRVANRAQNLDAAAALMGRTILVGAGFGFAAAMLLGLVVARRITAPIVEMTRVADDFRKEYYGSRVKVLPAGELGILGEALNQLGSEITRRVHMIQKDDARLRAMLSGIVEAIVAVDEQGHIVFSNNAGAKLMGVDRRSAKERSLDDLQHVNGLDDLIQSARLLNETKTAVVNVMRDSREAIFQAHATPFEMDEANGVVAVLHDITELRRLERIRRDFVANVSHELKTPLTSIQGYVETLLDGAVNDQKNNLRFLSKIETHVARLGHLVSDLLSLARIESQGDGMATTSVEWGPLVHTALHHHESAMRNGEIECSVEGSCPAVDGDLESMTQVLDNLLSNAIKYTPHGGRVEVFLGTENGHGILEVRDTGIGIPEEDLDRVFERFYRVDKARSRELGGTGLGLAIVKHLVQSMQGEVAVRSKPGEGSAFRVEIPLA